MTVGSPPRVAVLIDGDNISPKVISLLFNHIAGIGDPIVRRVYSNLSGGSGRWGSAAADRSLRIVHVPSVSDGKNATDIALTIDAMDTLSAGRVDAFAIVSSDSDFTPLATRIRESGSDVHGYGAAHTPAAFQRACSSFTFLEELLFNGKGQTTMSARWTLAPSQAEALLVLAVLRLGGATREVSLSELGAHLKRYEPHFDPKQFKCKGLGSLVEKLDSLEVLHGVNGNTVRLKVASGGNGSTSTHMQPAVAKS
jgi:hypothetical protein